MSALAAEMRHRKRKVHTMVFQSKKVLLSILVLNMKSLLKETM